MGRYRTVTDLASFCRHIRSKGLTLAPADAEDADLPDVVDLVCPKPPPPPFAELEACTRRMVEDRIAPGEVEGFGPGYQVALPATTWLKLQQDPDFIAARERGDVLDSSEPWWDAGIRIDQRTGRRVPFYDVIPGQRFLLMRAPMPVH